MNNKTCPSCGQEIRPREAVTDRSGMPPPATLLDLERLRRMLLRRAFYEGDGEAKETLKDMGFGYVDTNPTAKTRTLASKMHCDSVTKPNEVTHVRFLFWSGEIRETSSMDADYMETAYEEWK